jgi:hypothetical protein
MVRKEYEGSTDEFRRRVEFFERAILLVSCKGSVVLSSVGCCRTLLLIAVNVVLCCASHGAARSQKPVLDSKRVEEDFLIHEVSALSGTELIKN